MATSVFFNNYANYGEQTLIEDLIIESIKIHGLDSFYMPRTLNNRDPLYREDDASSYDAAYMLEMHMKGTAGFGGPGDFLSPLGDEIRDTVTLVVAIRRFNAEVKDSTGQLRPNEGDLVYFPLNRKVFKVMFVEHEAIFYQMGTLQVYELRCELFDYSGEVFNTGYDFIDSIVDGYSTDVVDSGIVNDEENDLPVVLEDFTGLDSVLTGDNDYYQVEGLKVIDFSELDPFADNEEY